MSHFSENRNPIWKENERKWEYAWDHYTGEYADWENSVAKVSDYLHQKYQRENKKAFEERMKVSDVVMHFATIIDGINGVLATKEDKTDRDWGALATYDEEGEINPDSLAYKIKHNADLQGTNWTPLMKRVGIKQTVLHSVWGLVEGVTENDEAHIKVISPQHVVDWYPTYGRLEQVLVKEQRSERSSIFDNADDEDDIYTLFTIDGWRRFKVTEGESGEDVEQVLGEGEYQYFDSKDRKKRILPIFRVEIPMPRQIGYLLAMKENHIYNQVSVRDFAIRNLSFAILNLMVDSEDQYTEITSHLEKGANILPSYSERGQHGFISPDSSYLSEAENVLRNKIEDYYLNGFKKFGEAASQVTATQVRLENQSGIESFLSLLVTSIDEFENQCFKRIEQVYFPDRPNEWGKAYVRRSRDFQAEDVNEAFVQITSGIRNASQAGAMSTFEMVRRMNPTWKDDDIKKEVERINAQNGAIPDSLLGD